MLGLRTQGDLDDKEFCRFFEIVQQAASEKGCVFFLDTSEGNTGEVSGIVCEELSGWLVPNEMVERFVPIWKTWGDVNSVFGDRFSFAEWINDDGAVRIIFD